MFLEVILNPLEILGVCARCYVTINKTKEGRVFPSELAEPSQGRPMFHKNPDYALSKTFSNGAIVARKETHVSYVECVPIPQC